MKHRWTRIGVGNSEVFQCIHCNLLRVVDDIGIINPKTKTIYKTIHETRYYLNGEKRIRSGECKNQKEDEQ